MSRFRSFTWSTGDFTRFTDARDPKPRFREVFIPPAGDFGKVDA